MTFSQTAGDPFWSHIINVRLKNGGIACNVIRYVSGHDDHFHLRFDAPTPPAVPQCPQNPPQVGGQRTQGHGKDGEHGLH